MGQREAGGERRVKGACEDRTKEGGGVRATCMCLYTTYIYGRGGGGGDENLR